MCSCNNISKEALNGEHLSLLIWSPGVVRLQIIIYYSHGVMKDVEEQSQEIILGKLKGWKNNKTSEHGRSLLIK